MYKIREILIQSDILAIFFLIVTLRGESLGVHSLLRVMHIVLKTIAMIQLPLKLEINLAY